MAFVDYTSIGTKVRKARLEQQLSQEQLAELCNISASFLGHIERGTRKMSLETFYDICTILHLTPSYLLDVENNNAAGEQFTIDLSSLGTISADKKQAFIKAVRALAAGIDNL